MRSPNNSDYAYDRGNKSLQSRSTSLSLTKKYKTEPYKNRETIFSQQLHKSFKEFFAKDTPFVLSHRPRLQLTGYERPLLAQLTYRYACLVLNTLAQPAVTCHHWL